MTNHESIIQSEISRYLRLRKILDSQVGRFPKGIKERISDWFHSQRLVAEFLIRTNDDWSSDEDPWIWWSIIVTECSVLEDTHEVVRNEIETQMLEKLINGN